MLAVPCWVGAGVLFRNPDWSFFVLLEFPAIVDLVHDELILSVVRAGIRPWTSGRLGILL